MNFEKLEDIRKEKGMTQMDMAREVGVNINAYIRWEKQVAKPNEENMKKLKEVLGVKEGK